MRQSKNGRYTALLGATLVLLLLAGCDRPGPITEVNLRDLSGAPAGFHGYYVVDGVTNRVAGVMPTNFHCHAQSLVFEFFANERRPLGFELTVSRSNVWQAVQSRYGIRGRATSGDSGSEWHSESFGAPSP